ncbi:muts domain V-domain-containing protein [Crepidotus variabilis]|uniref:DNA mismatch repair protein n=1 Tax=Crepidotus variabilis TaxID=179855 RepID=A0A9P6EG94_9AGAR|nr:muts domain V-domain-containing protein [Crepidotus variabilis]
MPPKPKASTDAMKQKSLTSFFAKPGAISSSSKPFKPPAPKQSISGSKSSNAETHASTSSSKNAVKSNTPSSPAEPKTPEAPHTSSSSGFQPSSVAYSRRASSPPTSDAIDVDMIDSEEESQLSSAKSVGQSRQKRKVVLDDSDNEATSKGQLGKKKERQFDSSPTAAIRNNPKRQRISKLISEDEDEDEEAETSRTSFSQRLSRFKKSPVKAKSRSRSRASSDDDDFIVPDDSEEEAPSVKSGKSSRRSSTSSRHSIVSSDDEDVEMDEDDLNLEDDVPEKSKRKAKAAASKPKASMKSAKASAALGGGGSSFSMLTAAEQREQNKKEDKKSNEESFGFLQDVRDKDGKRPGELDYDPRTLYVPKSAWATFTPFEKQFWEIKQNHFDTILFFQKGKFFELYEDDARIGHQQFDLKLTNRVKMCMVGVPEMSFNLWASKFLAKGYKVGRVEQAETALGAEMRMAAEKADVKGKVKAKAPAADKIVRRELNKVYTVGTLVEEAFLTDEQAGHCVAICESTFIAEDGTERDSERKFGICILDCSTSEFNLSFFEDDVCRTKLETLLRQIRPKELLFKNGSLSTNTQRLLKAILPQGCLWTSLRSVEGHKYDETLEELKRVYPSDDSAMEEDDPLLSLLPQSVPAPIREFAHERLPIEALGSMMWYLRQLNIDKDILSMKNFNIYDPMKRGMGLTLDGQTLAHLEVLLNNEGGEEGSLLKLLSRCVTPSGKRLFRIWLSMPLQEVSAINARQDAVQDILDHPSFESAFMEVAKGLPDLERIVSRVHAKNCKVMAFLGVLKAFRKLNKGLIKLADEAESFKSNTIFGLLRGAPDLSPNVNNVESMFQPSTEEKADELIPRPGKDERYDEIIEEMSGLEKELEGELKQFEKKLGIKLGYWHSAVGNKDIYLIEVATSVNKDKLPKDWVKSSGTKAKNRFVVTSLQKRVRQLKEAQENRNTAIKAFKERVFIEFDLDRSLWLRAIRVLAELDCLFSLAKSSSAIGEPSCRPEFVEGNETILDFQELRHPTLCLNSRMDSFIPNDIKMGGDVGKIVLLTGPNMAGKSTVMRMTATGVIMAQMGMLVPAANARLSAVDMIATRMGAYDNMFSNASTFKVELDECCKILRNATPKSLVILDELGRGTSTFDGMAIASAVLHQLATHTLPLSFFATHYGSLTDDFAYHPNIRSMYMSTLVDDEKHELVFLYKLVNGVAESSFGTHVATLAGVPLPVVKRADVISKDFAEKFKEKLQLKQKKQASAQLPLVAQADFAYLYKLGTGQLELPEDPIRRAEVLVRMKSIIRQYL